MGIVVQGLALRFVAGLAPRVNTAMTSFRDDVQGKGIEPMQEFGDKAGRAFRIVLAGAKFIGTGIASAFDVVGKSLGGVVAQIEGFVTGGFEGFKRAREAVGEGLVEAIDQASQDIDKARTDLLDAFDSKPIEIKVRAGIDRRAVEETAQDAQAQIQQRVAALAKATATDELKALQDAASRRRTLAEEAIKLEQEKGRAIVSAQSDAAASQRRLDADEEAALRKRAQLVTEAFEAERAVIRAREEALIGAARKQFGEGRAAEQLQVEITRQAIADRLGLQQRYYSDLVRLQTEQLARYRSAQDAIKAIDQDVANTRREREAIFAEAARSRLTSEERIAAAAKRAADARSELGSAVLRNSAAEVKALSDEITGLLRDLASAPGFEAFAAKIDAESRDLLNTFASVQKQAQAASASSSQAAAKTLDVQINDALQSVQKLQAELLQGVRLGVDEQSLTKMFADLQERFRRNPFEVVVTARLAGAPTPGLATGGVVTGSSPHARADNIPAMLTAGEYVLPVPAVRKYGLDFLESLRRGEHLRSIAPPRFADGGLVDLDSVRRGAQVHLRAIPGFATGGLVEQARAVSDDGGEFDTAGMQTINLQLNGEPVGALRGPRARIRAFQRDLQAASRGTAK